MGTYLEWSPGCRVRIGREMGGTGGTGNGDRGTGIGTGMGPNRREERNTAETYAAPAALLATANLGLVRLKYLLPPTWIGAAMRGGGVEDRVEAVEMVGRMAKKRALYLGPRSLWPP